MTDLLGNRIWFEEERNPYTIKAVSRGGRWAVCTKPFAARSTVVYTVVDFQLGLRGRDDHHGLGYETDEDCRAALAMFEAGDAEHSHRYPPIPLRIKKIGAR
jgi:hypothetical protein